MALAVTDHARRSFLYRELEKLGAAFEEVNGYAAAMTCGADAESEAVQARDAAVAARPPDGGSATVGGTFPDDPPRPTPLMVPETAPEWSPAELERYLHVVAMERHTAHAIRRHDLMDRLHQHCDGVGRAHRRRRVADRHHASVRRE